MYKIIKRLIDVVLSGITLVVLLPFLIPIIIALKLTGEGEIWYFQDRIGYKNKIFKIWKFATMVKNSPNLGTGSLTVRNDPRVTRIGKYLRISKVNELPQVVNVLLGDMSIVGPRPQVQNDFDVYPDHVKQKINDTKPGITGIGSIIFRDEEELMSSTKMPIKEFYAKEIAPYKGELELWYHNNLSLKTDLLLIFLTAWAIIFPKTKLVYSFFPGLPEKPKSLQLVN